MLWHCVVTMIVVVGIIPTWWPWDSHTHQFQAASSPALYWSRLHWTLCPSIPSLLHHWFSVHKHNYKHLLNNFSYNNVNGKNQRLTLMISVIWKNIITKKVELSISTHLGNFFIRKPLTCDKKKRLSNAWNYKQLVLTVFK